MKQVEIVCSHDCINFQKSINGKLAKIQETDDYELDSVHITCDNSGRFIGAIVYDNGE